MIIVMLALCFSWLATKITSTNTISLSFTSTHIAAAVSYNTVLTSVSTSISTRITHVQSMLTGITGSTQNPTEVSNSIATLAVQSEVG